MNAKKTICSDSHWHLNRMADPEGSFEKAGNAGIHRIIVPGTGYADNIAMMKLLDTRRYENVYFALGIHPKHTYTGFRELLTKGPKTEESKPGRRYKQVCRILEDRVRWNMLFREYLDTLEEQTEKLAEIASGNRKVIAIGETGLDYSAPATGQEEKMLQACLFHMQIETALKLRKPLILHIRPGDDGQVYEDALWILRSYKSCFKGVLHCFTAEHMSMEQAEAFAELGFYFGIGGAIMYPGSRERMTPFIKQLGSGRLLAETDAPYMAPPPEDGVRSGMPGAFRENDPAVTIPGVIKTLAEIDGITEEQQAAMLEENFERVFL